ncbi:cytochrome P450 [Xylariaceae sp. FL0255]|nr:cytochrome P450 [Xylariaceae sp. FL0255]
MIYSASILYPVASMVLEHPISILASILLCILTYQVFLHPLRQYPGPLIAKFTNGYTAFFAMRRSLHEQTFADHKKYGSVIRHSPNKLVFNTMTALKQIYQSERVTKPVNYLANQTNPGSFNTWNSTDREIHRQKRRLMAPAVNERSMKTFEPIIIEQVDIFLKQIASRRGSPINMKSQCVNLAMDIIGLLSFGFALKCQTEEDHRFLADRITISNRRLNTYMQVPFIPQYRIQSLINMLWFRARERVHHLIEHMVKSRMKQSQDARHDFYSFVANALRVAEGKNLRVNDLWTEAILFIVAATFFCLAHNPSCYQKVAREIRASFQVGSEICSSKLASCRYLRACIDESLRLSPPIPGTLWRQQASDDTGPSLFTVDGHVIPRGTYDYFPDPFRYDPERWLADKGMNTSKLEPFAPFSTGSRGCPGKAMAYMELSLVLAKSLWYFDFQPAPGSLGQVGCGKGGEFRLYDVYISTHDGPWLNFTPRKGFSEDFLGAE